LIGGGLGRGEVEVRRVSASSFFVLCGLVLGGSFLLDTHFFSLEYEVFFLPWQKAIKERLVVILDK
jgi:hypothetical protein